ncbi:MAG: Thiol-disulfide oxidoreductase ResA [Verrucomicrobia subdivision 3 bacterium]|nr:Thiol-disulfide oxidoreductase ResA [Limisphaerales bacterium]MCS1414810.1 Thiol-disulfide oxidoreductase ResA [Limisphaerales bacterium]
MKKILLLLTTSIMLATPGYAGAKAQRLEIGDQSADFSLYDTKRRLRSLSSYSDAKALALVFTSTECPLVKLYLPTLKTLNESFSNRGVQIVLVNSDPGDSFNRVAGHAWENELPFPVLKDFDQSLAKSLGATKTPEVFLLDGQRTLRYRGRIDDQYTVTHRRVAPRNHNLKTALNQVLAGKTVETAETMATGCTIDYSGNPYADTALSYTTDIAPIVASNCLECHQKGRVGQIAFNNYRQLRRFAKTIREVVSEQRMPPWHADPHYGEFANDRSLSDDERNKLLAWIDQGSPEGEPATSQTAANDAQSPWVIGQPDLVLQMPVEQQVPATGIVDYQYYTVDPGFTEDVWVQAAEARPGNMEVVHHIVAYIVAPGKRIFDRDGETAILVGWAPGDMPARYAPGIARRIPSGSKLRFEMHYTPNGEATVDRSSIGIIFAKKRPEREIHTNIMWQRELLIPVGAGWHADTATYQFRDDARILTLMPHMHLRGAAAKYILTHPDGRQQNLLTVPYYDFNWQSVYRFKEPILIPKGAKLTVTGVWDNSADNPNNPDPTREVPWGDQTWDEMLNGWVDFVYEKPDHPRDLAANLQP